MIWQRGSVSPSGQIIEVIDGDTVLLNGAAREYRRRRAAKSG
jgi:hypothetical protein